MSEEANKVEPGMQFVALIDTGVVAKGDVIEAVRQNGSRWIGRWPDAGGEGDFGLSDAKLYRRIDAKPTKVEPRVGQVWRKKETGTDHRLTRELSGRPESPGDEWSWEAEPMTVLCFCNDCYSKKTLISDPSSPTKEAEPTVKVSLCKDCGAAYGTHAVSCGTLKGTKAAEPAWFRWTSATMACPPPLAWTNIVGFDYGYEDTKPPAMTEAEICAATEKRNAAYQEEQAAKIKARWLEQQRNPRQYMAYGVVSAGGWQQRGRGRK